MGILGFCAWLWSASIQGTDTMKAENLGIMGQFLSVFRNFAFVPIVLLFNKYYGIKSDNKVNWIPIAIYMGVLAAVSIATTRRTILFNMIISWAIMTLFIALLENRKLFSKKTTFFFIVGFYLVTGPMVDIAMAMIISRSQIYSSSSSDTFSNVIDLYSDKETLHQLYQLGSFSN